MIATISLDDGGPADFDLIDALLPKEVVPTIYLLSCFVNTSDMLYGMPAAELKQRYERVEVGSHSVSHPHLSLADEQHTMFELTHSKRCLEETLERPITLFAHPFGSAGPLTEGMLPGCGYQWARRIHRATGKPTNRFRMPIDVMFHSGSTLEGLESEERLVAALVNARQPIHILGHSWWIVRHELLPRLRTWIDLLQGEGYEFLTNSQYFEQITA